jgi:phage terminase small subunit
MLLYSTLGVYYEENIVKLYGKLLMEEIKEQEKEIKEQVEVTEKVISTEAFVRPPSRIVRQFVRYYIEQGYKDGAEAARKAGSTAKNPNHIAYQWLQDPWVKQEIERSKELKARGENPLELIKEEDVIEKLTRVYEAAMSSEDFTPAIKAVELMGKQIGMFANTTNNISVKKTITENTTTIDGDRFDQLTKVLQQAQNARGKVVDVSVKEKE